jgi:hypothetical protein
LGVVLGLDVLYFGVFVMAGHKISLQ